MPICSYLVIPDAGAGDRVEARLADLAGCEVVRAENRDVLLLVTETATRDEEDALRVEVEGLDGIQALLLTFGDIDPGRGREAGGPDVRGGRERRVEPGAPGRADPC